MGSFISRRPKHPPPAARSADPLHGQNSKTTQSGTRPRGGAKATPPQKKARQSRQSTATQAEDEVDPEEIARQEEQKALVASLKPTNILRVETSDTAPTLPPLDSERLREYSSARLESASDSDNNNTQEDDSASRIPRYLRPKIPSGTAENDAGSERSAEEEAEEEMEMAGIGRTQSEQAIMFSALLQAASSAWESSLDLVEGERDKEQTMETKETLAETAEEEEDVLQLVETAEEEEDVLQQAARLIGKSDDDEEAISVEGAGVETLPALDLDVASRLAFGFERTASQESAEQHASFIAPEPRPREPAKDENIVRGDLRLRYEKSDLSDYLVLTQRPNVIRALLSSTLSPVELAVIARDVAAPLQQLAAAHGFQILLVDAHPSRFHSAPHNAQPPPPAVAPDAAAEPDADPPLDDTPVAGADAHAWNSVLEELQYCQAVSAGVTMVFLSCDQYGQRFPPTRIPQQRLDALLEHIHDAPPRQLVQDAYKLDANAIILPPQFRSAPPEAGPTQGTLEEWFAADGPQYALTCAPAQYGKVREVLEGAAQGLWPQLCASNLRAAAASDFGKKLFIGREEELLSLAEFWPGRDREEGAQRVVVAERRFEAVPAEEEAARDFTDVGEDGQRDAEAKELLEGLHRLVADKFGLSAPQRVTIEWAPGKGLDAGHAGHALYLGRLSAAVKQGVEASLQAAMARELQADACLAEVEQHLAFAMRSAKEFHLGAEASEAIFRIKSYIANNATGRALLLTGRAGCGKTALLSKVVADAATEASQQGRVCVARFVGASTKALSVHALLHSMCLQLCRAYRKPEEIPHAFPALVALFRSAVLTWPSPFTKLTLVIDGVDELDAANVAHQLNWLPVTEIPSNAAVIVSASSAKFADPSDRGAQCVPTLRLRMGRANLAEQGGWKAVAALVRRKSLIAKAGSAPEEQAEAPAASEPEESIIELGEPAEGGELLQHLLTVRGRAATAEQARALEAAYKLQQSRDRVGGPLWLRLAAQAAGGWRSFDAPAVVQPTVLARLYAALGELRARHGEALLRKTLGCVGVSRQGVREGELACLLSLDDAVLAEGARAWWPLLRAASHRAVPSCAVAALVRDLRPWLRWRDRSGVAAWSHKQIAAAASGFAFGSDPDYRGAVHRDCAEFFGGVHAGVPKPYSDALRSVMAELGAEEEGAERLVPPQPLVLAGDVFDPRGRPGALKLNHRRMAEYALHCIRGGMAAQACTELSSVLYIGAKVAAGAGSELVAELAEARGEFAGLQRVWLFVLKYLEECGSTPWAILQAALNEPDESPVFVSARSYRAVNECPYAMDLLRKPQGFHPCMATWEETHTILCITCCPMGEWVAYGLINGVIKIAASKTSEVIHTLLGHSHTISSVSFSSSRERLVSGSYDKSVRQWDCKTGKQIGAPIKAHTDKVMAVCYSPDGKTMASGSLDRTVRLWHARTGLPSQQLEKLTAGINALAFSPDGNRLVSGSADGSVRVWDLAERRQEGGTMRHEAEVTCVQYSADGAWIASGGHDKTIRQWDAATQEPFGAVMAGHADVVASLAWSTDGKRIVSAGGGRDRTVRLWDAERCGLSGAPWSGHANAVNGVCFSPDGTTVYSAGSDKSVREWDVETGAKMEGKGDAHARGAQCLAFSPSGAVVASGGLDKVVKVWDARTGELLLPPLEGHSHVIRGLAWARGAGGEDMLVSGSMDRTLMRWEVEGGAAVGGKMEGHTSALTCVRVSADGKRILSASDDHTLRLWDAESGEAVGEPLQGHKEEVNDAAFSPCGRLVASGAMDNAVRLWAVEGGSCLVELKGHNKAVTCVAFSPDGAVLASGSRDGTVRRWDVEERTKVKGALMGHSEGVQRVGFSPDGGRLFSSSEKGVKQWDTRTGSAIGDGGLRGSLFAVDAERGNQLLVTAENSGAGAVRVFDITYSAVLIALFLPRCPVTSIACKGGVICVGCSSGSILHVRVPFMLPDAPHPPGLENH